MSDTELKDVNLSRSRRPRSLTGGFVLIALGIVFLLQQTGRFSLHNWWALFILIPAFAGFATTYALYRSHGFNQAVRGNLFGGFMILAVALMFLMDLSWAVYWPIFIILPGLSSMAGGLPLSPSGDFRPRVMQLFAGPWLFCLGLGTALLGAGFLLQNLGVFEVGEVLGPRWWSLAILLTAVGGLVATLRLLAYQRRLGAAVVSNLVGTVVVTIVGLVALLGLDWNLLWPITLIAAGAVVLLGVLGNQHETPAG